MEKKNITLSLPKKLLIKAKTFASERESSISGLVQNTLEELIDHESGYHAAKNRQIELMKKGFNMGLGGKAGISREKLRERGWSFC